MSIKDNHSRRVTFDTGDELGDEVDKLTVMTGKLAAQVDNLNLKFIKARKEDKIGVVMIDMVMINELSNRYRSDSGDRIDKIKVDQGMNKIIEEILEAMQGHIKILRQNSRGEYRNKYRDEGYIRSRDSNRPTERSFSRNFSKSKNKKSTSNSRSRSESRTSTETESDVTSVGNMIISQNNFNKCLT